MVSAVKDDVVTGKNGVVIIKRPLRAPDGSGYRTYEIHQRERVGESSEKIKPIQLISDDYRIDPYPPLAILRENYPSYRDWLSNSYWITQYNDVTSIYTDEANFETRPKRWYYDLNDFGRDLGDELAVLTCEETLIDENAPLIATSLAANLAKSTSADLARDFCTRFTLDLLTARYDIPSEDAAEFSSRYWRMQRGTSWMPKLQQDGRQAIDELVTYFEPIVAERTKNPGSDIVSAMVQLDTPANAKDVVITLLEGDHATLHGALSNLWFLLLTHPQEYEKARSERRVMKLACLETLRHSTPVLTTNRFARHEVERFGKLIPEGARLVCAAAAANRDPRIFKDPDTFIANREDMCQREARGQYRADGLAMGVAFGLGKPSVYPAVPEDRPRSHYAITRDTVVTAAQILSDHLQNLSIADGVPPKLSSLTVGEMHTCWSLPVTYK